MTIEQYQAGRDLLQALSSSTIQASVRSSVITCVEKLIAEVASGELRVAAIFAEQ